MGLKECRATGGKFFQNVGNNKMREAYYSKSSK